MNPERGRERKLLAPDNIVSQLLHKVNMKKQLSVILKVLEIIGLIFFLWFALNLVIKEISL